MLIPRAALHREGRILDASGFLVTPGFVDSHTHYDGQVCWDKRVTPSSWHGVTTVVMGNCGVGFAPVRPGSEDELVSLMESVEDIPGTALHEGIPWGWETFPEYLDAIDTPYAVDIGAQVPHVAVRHYVMGDRCYDEATSKIWRRCETSREMPLSRAHWASQHLVLGILIRLAILYRGPTLLLKRCAPLGLSKRSNTAPLRLFRIG